MFHSDYILPPELQDDELLTWLIEHADDELWMPRVPLIVLERCERRHALVATWLAIWRLLIRYRPIGRTALSLREIALVARVGRNRLGGDDGYLAQLVQLGLLDITGQEINPARPQERRTDYAIHIQRLEAASVVRARQTIAAGQRPAPPKPPAAQRQLDLCALLGVDAPPAAAAASTRTPMDHTLAPHGARNITPAMESVAGWPRMDSDPAPFRASSASHPNRSHLVRPQTGPEMIPNRARDGLPSERLTYDSVQAAPHLASDSANIAHSAVEMESPAPDHGPVASTPWPPMDSTLAPHGDVGTSEGWKGTSEAREGVDDVPRTHTELLALIQDTITKTASTIIQQTLSRLQHAQLIPPPMPAVSLPLPEPPPDCPALPAPVETIWAADRSISEYELILLRGLCSQYDPLTDGYGAYWVGRAVLSAELIFYERDDRPGIGYVRAILKRWHRENSWGSDRDFNIIEIELTGKGRTPVVREPHQGKRVADNQSAPDSAPVADPHRDNPAVQRYVQRAGLPHPPAAHTALIARYGIENLPVWETVLELWAEKKHDFTNLTGLFDRYSRECALRRTIQARSAARTAPVEDRAMERDQAHQRLDRTNALLASERVPLAARAQKDKIFSWLYKFVAEDLPDDAIFQRLAAHFPDLFPARDSGGDVR
ncbi:MAG: hypothetical protein MI924_12035 [Chloroflexales bacterium]|nr:hypothetical protein [Chloroflexales bacterium]